MTNSIRVRVIDVLEESSGFDLQDAADDTEFVELGLDNQFEVTSTNLDRNGKPFVSTIEPKRSTTGDYYYPANVPSDIQIAVAGGAGKHSAFIPAFGNTAASSKSYGSS